ncbi:ankyrin repeat-containing domain protein, partial [Baffinella frigidus]
HGNTPLMHAAYLGLVEFVMLLIEHGSDIHTSNERGETALHLAVDTQHLGCVQVLIDKGFRINYQDDEGNTLLHTAVENRKNDSLRLLLYKGLDPYIKNRNGFTPLGIALYKPNAQFAITILQAEIT